ncbi:MAG: response regulator [Pirellulales bacterium]|nr:response regulator [Pirellulales bacterium]
MKSQRSVLIVDQSEENREVLRTVLERHGVRTMTAARTTEGVDLARRHQPDVIVLDTEFEATELGVFCGKDRGDSEIGKPPMILLGKVRRNRSVIPEGEFFAKPYHYGPLIRRIEEILDKIPRKVA